MLFWKKELPKGLFVAAEALNKVKVVLNALQYAYTATLAEAAATLQAKSAMGEMDA